VSYTVFARKYRPQRFEDVLGQEHITRTLRNAIEQNRIAHAYIFVGPRGTGKTSTARIFAMALNATGGPKADFDPEDDACKEIAQGRSLDVIEIDGASNNGVEQVRELRDSVRFAPARGRFKIYIIDEVHMLTTAAFNALLKTLEEPPAHAKFLLATTDVQKVLPTILSRCQRFDLRRIPTATIAKHLLWIAGQEKFSLSEAAAEAVAIGAEGGLRDAESMLDQLVAFCGEKIEEEDVLKIFGFTSRQAVSDLCDAILSADSSAALRAIHGHAEAGKDLSRLLSDLIAHFRNLLVIKADPQGLGEEVMPEALASLEAQAARVPIEKLLDLIDQFAAAEGRMKWAPNKKMHFEVALIRAIQTLQSATLTEVLDTLTALRGGAPPPPSAPTPKPAATAPKQRSRAAAAPAASPAPAAKAPASKSQPEPAPIPASKAAPVAAAPSVPEVTIPCDQEAAEAAAATPAPPASAAAQPNASAQGDPAASFWPNFVAAIRKERMLISAWLEAGAPLSIQRNEVQIAFPPDQSFAKEFLDGHVSFLEEVASSILGSKVKLRMLIKEGVTATPVAATPPPPPRDPMAEFKDDALIRKALEEFRGRLELA
jgi:DNA polymerase-3 subunit gamma/tau